MGIPTQTIQAHAPGSVVSVTGLARRRRRPISIQPLKIFAMRYLPPGSALRHAIMTDKDTLSVEDFLGRIPVWLSLSSLEEHQGPGPGGGRRAHKTW